MTVALDPDTVEAARNRDGAPAEDRPERIADALGGPTVGRGEGDPLAAENYARYPDADNPESLSNPKWSPLLRSLLDHSAVTDFEDAANELAGAEGGPNLEQWTEAIRRAASALQIDPPFDDGDGGDDARDTLTTVLGHPVPDNAEPTNPILVAECYVAGLSVSEAATVLSEYTDRDIQPMKVRDILKQVDLLPGHEGEGPKTSEEEDIRLGGTTVKNRDSPSEGESGGLSVNVNDF